MVVRQPLETVDLADKFDFHITVKGGGMTGQAGAIRHGVTRALMVYDESLYYHPEVKESKENLAKKSKETRDLGYGSKYRFYH